MWRGSIAVWMTIQDVLIRPIYGAVRASPFWEKTVLAYGWVPAHVFLHTFLIGCYIYRIARALQLAQRLVVGRQNFVKSNLVKRFRKCQGGEVEQRVAVLILSGGRQ